MSEIQDDVRAAMESLRGGDGEAATSDDGGSGDAGAVGAGDAGAGDVSADPVAPEDGRADSQRTTGDRVRDDKGRFQTKASGATEPQAKPGKPEVAAPPAPGKTNGTTPPLPGELSQTPAPKFKAPQSWKQELKEKWGSVPAEVQGEIDRRERETAVALKEAAGVKQFAGDIHRAMTPFEPLLRSFGAHPAEALSNVLQTVHQLHNGPVPQRAKALAQLIDQSGVPIDAINAHWQGQPAPNGANGWGDIDPQTFAQQLKQEWMSELAQKREQVARQQTSQEILAFATDSAHEFVNEDSEHADRIWARMSGLMQGPQAMDLKQAYEEACWADGAVRKILMQREAAQQANAVNASTQRARAAASTVKHHPSTASTSDEEPESIHDYVRAAMRKHATR